MKHRSTDAANVLNRRGGVGHGLIDGVRAGAESEHDVCTVAALGHRVDQQILRRDTKGEVYAAGEEQCGKTDR